MLNFLIFSSGVKANSFAKMVDLLTSDDVDKIVAEIHRRFPETSSDNFDADTPAERLSLARETLAKSTFSYHKNFLKDKIIRRSLETGRDIVTRSEKNGKAKIVRANLESDMKNKDSGYYWLSLGEYDKQDCFLGKSLADRTCEIPDDVEECAFGFEKREDSEQVIFLADDILSGKNYQFKALIGNLNSSSDGGKFLFTYTGIEKDISTVKAENNKDAYKNNQLKNGNMSNYIQTPYDDKASGQMSIINGSFIELLGKEI